MTGILFIPSVVRALDANGNPLNGATWTFYETETLTLAPIYIAADLDDEHPNPVTANSGGMFELVFLDPATSYRAILKTSAGVEVKDVDPYNTTDEAESWYVHGQFLGPDPPEPQQLLSGQMFPDDITVTFTENFNGDFWFYARTPPSDDYVIDVRQDGASIGSITVDDAGAAVVAVTASTFTGGRMTFIGPDTSTAIVEFIWTIRGTVSGVSP